MNTTSRRPSAASVELPYAGSPDLRRLSSTPQMNTDGSMQTRHKGPWLTEVEGILVPPKKSDFAWVGCLYKRRSGFGKMASNNWRPRCFCITKKGVLLYYEESSFDKVDFSEQPRSYINFMEGECVLSPCRVDSESLPDFGKIIEWKVGKKDSVRWKVCASTEDDIRVFTEVATSFLEKHKDYSDGSPPQLPRKSLDAQKDSSTKISTSSLKSSNSQNSIEKKQKNLEYQAFLDDMKSPLSSPRKAGVLENRKDPMLSVGALYDKRKMTSFSGLTYFIMLMVVNCSVVCLVFLRLPPWNPFYVVFAALINIAICLGTPKRESSIEGRCVSVPLVHEQDIYPIIKSIRNMQRVKRKREILLSSANGTVIAKSLIPDAGSSMIHAKDVKPGDLNAPHHSWQDGNPSIFNVRGPKYMIDGKKLPSAESLYTMIACDVYSTPERIDNVVEAHLCLKKLSKEVHKAAIDNVPSILVVNVQLPSEDSKALSTSDDGPSYQVIMYFGLTAQTAESLKDISTASNAVKLWVQYCNKQALDDQYRGRFKTIGIVENWTATALPTQLKGWNGKPVLITKTGKTFTDKVAGGEDVSYLEMDINVHKFRYPARKALFSLMDKFEALVLHVGFTIEGRSADELPEVLLACACLNFPNPKAVETLTLNLDDGSTA